MRHFLRSVATLTVLPTWLNTVLNRLIDSQHCKRAYHPHNLAAKNIILKNFKIQ